MPLKKKKLLRRKKKIGVIGVKTKKKSKTWYEGIVGAPSPSSGAASSAHKRPRFTSKKSSKVCYDYDKGGVKRIYSPFNRFANNTIRKADKHNVKMPYSDLYYAPGLSPKEKCYIICSCQTRTNQYIKLKHLAADAIVNNKIFAIYGSCNAVRKALVERGWVEKISATRMNLGKIRNGTLSNKTEIHGELERLFLSHLVERHPPNFIWRTREEHVDKTIDMSKDCTTMVNKLKIDALWTTKQGLCSSMKRNYWFYIEDVAEVSGPRTYNSYDSGDIDDFVSDFKITACTSLLKWVVSMVANDRPVFIKSGKISLNVMVFALNRCKEYLFRKQNKDIDRPVSSISSNQWNAFLKKYYRIISQHDVFYEDSAKRLPLYLGYAKFLLKEIHRYRPQLSCEGCHNIWIIKPAHCSRGRGIRMASKLGVITNLLTTPAHSKYVIQKYIEEPLLIYETKFDIRQYYLVTSTCPLVIWMYKDCYLKFSSQKYSLIDYHESIHLTNNAVQKKYKNCSNRHSDLPQNNMWDLDKYKSYLDKLGKDYVWDNIIYPRMRNSIVAIMLSCQDSVSTCKNRFELYGCDFILDKEYQPWLIEINSCPDLNSTTQVTAKICPAVVTDIIRVVIDYANDPKASTGKFECIYRQPMTIPRCFLSTDMTVRGYALPSEYFYKGTIEFKESFDHADITEERDIKMALDMMKKIYDEEVMIQAEDDCDINEKIERETSTHCTQSEYELSLEATCITGQLDELLKRITSSGYSVTVGTRQTNPQSNRCLTCVQSVKSVTDLKSFLEKSLNLQNSTDSTEVKGQNSFSFSKLDDGSSGHDNGRSDMSSNTVIQMQSDSEISNVEEMKSSKNSVIYLRS